MFRGEISDFPAEVQHSGSKNYLRFAYPLVLLALESEGSKNLSGIAALNVSSDIVQDPSVNLFLSSLRKGVNFVLNGENQASSEQNFGKMSIKSRVIGIDGLNASGKTTLIKELAGDVATSVDRIVLVDNLAEPFLKNRYRPDSVRLKDISGITETLLLGSNLYYKFGVLVNESRSLMDRSILSFLAYQTHVLSTEYNYPSEQCLKFLELVLSGLTPPEKTILLDIDIETMKKRTAIGSQDIQRFEDIASLFKSMSRTIPNVFIVDAKRDIRRVVEEVRSITS